MFRMNLVESIEQDEQMTIVMMALIGTKLIGNYRFVQLNSILRVRIMIDEMQHRTKLREVCFVILHLNQIKNKFISYELVFLIPWDEKSGCSPVKCRPSVVTNHC